MTEFYDARKVGAEIRQNAENQNLPAYKVNGETVSDIDYTKALTAYVMNVTLVYGDATTIDGDSELLLVRHAVGPSRPRSTWSGVSGYIDTKSDPDKKIPDNVFDPVRHTARTELKEEAQLSRAAIANIDFTVGRRYVESRNNKTLNVFPVAGVVDGEKPLVKPDGYEVTDFEWVPLGKLNEFGQCHDLSSGYREQTLPRALGAAGLERVAYDLIIA